MLATVHAVTIFDEDAAGERYARLLTVEDGDEGTATIYNTIIEPDRPDTMTAIGDLSAENLRELARACWAKADEMDAKERMQ